MNRTFKVLKITIEVNNKYNEIIKKFAKLPDDIQYHRQINMPTRKKNKRYYKYLFNAN